MVTDPEVNLDDAVRLENAASMGRSGGPVIPLSSDLREALGALLDDRRGLMVSDFIIRTGRIPRPPPRSS
jgi:hypothetical protein